MTRKYKLCPNCSEEMDTRATVCRYCKGGHKHSDDTKDKIGKANSKALKGRILPDEHRANIGNYWRDRPKSEGHKKAIGKGNKGKKRTQFHKDTLRLAHLGTKHSKETRLRMSLSAKVRKHNRVSKLELRVAEWLSNFQHSAVIDRYRVDLVNPELRLIIEVQGCFYHGCDYCGFSPIVSGVNRVLQDSKRFNRLQAIGWTVVALWEHSITEKNSSLEDIIVVGDLHFALGDNLELLLGRINDQLCA